MNIHVRIILSLAAAKTWRSLSKRSEAVNQKNTGQAQGNVFTSFLQFRDQAAYSTDFSRIRQSRWPYTESVAWQKIYLFCHRPPNLPTRHRQNSISILACFVRKKTLLHSVCFWNFSQHVLRPLLLRRTWTTPCWMNGPGSR